MTASYVAYIDEAGEEGFRFRNSPDRQGSSDWFILAAFITRKQTDVETVKSIDHIREEFNLPPRKHIHWRKLKHPQKVRYAQMISNLRARAVGICVHKPSLLEPEKFQERYRLYFYVVRHLLERVSWLARDMHDPAKWGGDGTVKILFSNRQGMSYEEMRDYLRHLEKQKTLGKNVQIDFDLVPPENIGTQSPGKSMGLQFADAIAGAYYNAFERDSFGNTEPRYIRTVFPLLYRRRGVLLGYGLKFLPKEAMANLKEEPSLSWVWEYT